MTPNRIVFLSDIHLSNKAEARYLGLLELLKCIQSHNCEKLVLLGDIFDLWVGEHGYFLDKFSDILSEFKRISLKEKIEVHYFEGNHDLYLQKYFGQELGFHIHSDFFETQWHQIQIRMEHGDLSNPEDHGYLFLRSFLRKAPTRFLLRKLPSKIIGTLGEKASEASRKYTDKIDLDAKNVMRNYAKNLALRSDFDLLITGHTHQRDDFEFSSTKIRRLINLGSWFGEIKILVIEEQTPIFIDLNDLINTLKS